ncbi:RYamide receptor-like [Argopecten irradians]|uniref:RYamide receptor-like n=1 Tax=Argopecten irradians TaxID=31199 RepID=UPI003719DEA3
MFANSSVPDVDMLDYWSKILAQQLRPVLVITAGYLILGTIGNIFVMVIYWVGNKSQGEDRFLIPFLALFDTCACAVCSGSAIITEVRPLRYDNNTVCKMMAFSSIACVAMSSNLLLIITIDRYLKICTPFRSQLTLRRKKIALAVIVFAGLVAALPSVVVYGSVPVTDWQGNVTGKLCINVPSGEGRIWHLTYKGVIFIYGSAHFLALVVLYLLILRSIYIRSKARLRLQSGQWQRPQQTKCDRIQTKQSQQKDISRLTETPGSSKASLNSIETVSDTLTVPEEPVLVTDYKVDSDPTVSEQVVPSTADRNNRDSCMADISTKDAVKDEGDIPQSNDNIVPDIAQLQRHGTKQAESKKSFKIKGLRLTLVFLVISIIYGITICLKLVLMTMESVMESFWTTMTPMEFVCFRFLYGVFVINFIVNPFVYGFLDREFQQSVKKRCVCIRFLNQR